MTRPMTIVMAPKPALGEVPDASLLDRFLSRKDESAFEELVRRHGPGVLRTCRRRLGDGQDAEDACQATFIVLIRRAGAIRKVDDVGSWLRGVARRVSLRAKMRADRERARKGVAVDVGEVAGPEEAGLDELAPGVRAEVERLPEKYRRPIELCYWEGLSNDQAAERLECPTGTVKWRLSRARELLRDRFVRRGLAMSAFLLLFRREAPAAPVPDAIAAPPAPPGAEGDVLSDAFVRGTLELAAFVRDVPLSLLCDQTKRPAGPPRPRRRRPGRDSIGVVALLAILATISVSISALAIGLPSGAERKAARFQANSRANASKAVARNAELREEMRKHCEGEAEARPIIPATSPTRRGLQP